jgi:hypothetical protein
LGGILSNPLGGGLKKLGRFGYSAQEVRIPGGWQHLPASDIPRNMTDMCEINFYISRGIHTIRAGFLDGYFELQ